MSAEIKPLEGLRSRIDGTTISECLRYGVDLLHAKTGTSRLEAEALLVHVLGCDRAHLYAHPRSRIGDEQLSIYRAFVERRALGEPLPYLTGCIEFFGLDLCVDPRVLIPRPETETLVDLALSFLASRACEGKSCTTVADIGTGSGCIAVALAVHSPDARVYALDLSSDALAVAKANARRHGVDQEIAFVVADLLAPIRAQIDLIVVNPPYIAAEEWSALPIEVKEHEPRIALLGGARGLDLIRRLLAQAPAHLRPGGAFLMEIGAEQGPDVLRMARQAFPTADTAIEVDLSGNDRVLCIRQPLRYL